MKLIVVEFGEEEVPIYTNWLSLLESFWLKVMATSRAVALSVSTSGSRREELFCLRLKRPGLEHPTLPGAMDGRLRPRGGLLVSFSPAAPGFRHPALAKSRRAFRTKRRLLAPPGPLTSDETPQVTSLFLLASLADGETWHSSPYRYWNSQSGANHTCYIVCL